MYICHSPRIRLLAVVAPHNALSTRFLPISRLPDHTVITFVARVEIRIEHLLLQRTKADMFVEVNTDRGTFTENRNAFVVSFSDAPLQQHTANTAALPVWRYIHAVELPAFLEITFIEGFRNDWQDMRDMPAIGCRIEEVEVVILNAMKC
jgi:hypothetical protein